MGAGNYLPHEHARCVYLSDECVYSKEDEDSWDFEQYLWDDLVDDIRTHLSKSYKDDDGWTGEHHLISSNGFYEVSLLTYCDNLVLTVQAKKADCWRDPWEYNPLAIAGLDDAAEALFSKLHASGYQMRVRHCAWTSGPYQPAAAQALAA